MTVVAMPVVVLAGGLLIYAGSSKLVALDRVAVTLAGLGVDAQYLKAKAGYLAAAEIAAGLAVIFAPGALAAAILTVVGSLFAFAGAYALLRSARVPCNCLGGGGGSMLGWRQIAQLPAWLAVSFLAFQVQALGTPSRVLAVDLALLGALLLHVRRLVPVRNRSKKDMALLGPSQ